MKLRKIGLSQVIRLLKVTSPSGSLYGPVVVESIADRYGFVEYPQTIKDLVQDGNNDIIFKHGKFQQTPTGNGPEIEAVIDSLSIHNDGIVIATRSTVENAEFFCNDFLDWAEIEFNLQYFDNDPVRIGYNSQVEIQLDSKFFENFSFLSSLQSKIGNILKSYNYQVCEFSCTGFSMHYDNSIKHIVLPSVFQVERKIGYDFEENIFFSQAPMKTADHLKLLEMVEGL